MDTILKYLFVSQFINTALILLSVQSNFENSHVPYLKKYANGPFPDFTMKWYSTVGSMYTQTLVIYTLMPIIDAIMNIVLLRLY